jgi:solute carrier family 8 (sodium/calcium exchanger)
LLYCYFYLCIPFSIYRVEPDTPFQDEPKFIVFYSMLLSLFNLFCFKCRQGKPAVTMTRNGSMVTVCQKCRDCGQSFQWKSQPLILGRYPAGNILLSSAVLLAGASISKILLVFKHMGLSAICARTFFLHQKSLFFQLFCCTGKATDQTYSIK